MLEAETVVSSGTMKVTCSREELTEKLAVVSRGVSTRTAVQILGGILLTAEPGRLTLAATDMELSLRASLEAQVDGEGAVVVPGRLLVELARLGQGAEQIELGVQENQVVFGIDGIWLTTRRIDGQFPNYKQLIPENFEHELNLPRDEVLDVVRRIAVMAQRNSPLRLRFAEGELTVSARTQDVGEAEESLPVPFGGEA